MQLATRTHRTRRPAITASDAPGQFPKVAIPIPDAKVLGVPSSDYQIRDEMRIGHGVCFNNANDGIRVRGCTWLSGSSCRRISFGWSCSRAASSRLGIVGMIIISEIPTSIMPLFLFFRFLFSYWFPKYIVIATKSLLVQTPACLSHPRLSHCCLRGCSCIAPICWCCFLSFFSHRRGDIRGLRRRALLPFCPNGKR